MQVRPESTSAGAGPPPRMTMVGQMLDISRKEGVGALWKGVGPSMGRASALTAAQCAVYDECKQLLKKQAGFGDGLPLHLSASMLAGAVSTLASSPFDTVKTRMMASRATKNAPVTVTSPNVNTAVSSSAAPTHATHSASQSSQSMGNQAVSSAAAAPSTSSSSASSSYLSSTAQRLPHRPLIVSPAYSTAAVNLPLPSLTTSSLTPALGSAASPSLTPATAASNPAIVYKSSLQCTYMILKTEGIRGLYKGCGANYARLAPMTAITFIVYEQLRQLAGLSSL